MKNFISSLLIFLVSVSAYAAPDKKVLDSCLRIQAVTPSVHYAGFKPTDYFQEEDSGVTSNTFMLDGLEIGTWEAGGGKNFGLVYKGRKIRQQDFVKLGPDEPILFDPAMAQWGFVNLNNQKYICSVFNFERLGQSGSFQNIRGIYVIDVKSNPVKIYYVVGDARKVLK